MGLARLIAASVPVPAGFAIDDRAFRAVVGELALHDPDQLGHVLAEAAERIAHAMLPAELEHEVVTRALELGTVLAVRSSSTIEDGEAGAGAGVFASRRAVPVADVWHAIRAVWTSALTPLAVAYARRRASAPGAIGVVIPGVHRQRGNRDLHQYSERTCSPSSWSSSAASTWRDLRATARRQSRCRSHFGPSKRSTRPAAPTSS